MPLERNNPLPAAKYWVEVGPDDSAAFDAWLTANEQAGAIHVETTSALAGDWNWVLFTVLSPVDWQGPGFPNIADASIHTYQDTQTSPPVADGSDVITSVENVAKNVAWGAFALLALYVIVNSRRS